MELNSQERIYNILHGQPVDRIGLFEHFWGDTIQKWTKNGHIAPGKTIDEHFKFDISNCFSLNMTANLDYKEEVIEETEETRLVKDGNGAILRRHKLHASTPEHVDFSVKTRNDWEEKIKPFLKPERRRINFELFKTMKESAEKSEQFFCNCGLNIFELMHPVCGHEHMLVGMALDPDWIKDMVETYSSLIVNLMEILFSECGTPDGIWFYEDMGFKGRPFLSPEMYREIIMPGHKKTIDFAHSKNLPVIMHSCGYIEPLLPGMIEAGIDCLQVIEIKAGMDLLRIHKNYGDKIALCGGMDARNIVSNDIDAIRDELRGKIPIVKKGYGYILHSDHSIPDTCDYETYNFFVEEGLKLGNY